MEMLDLPIKGNDMVLRTMVCVLSSEIVLILVLK